MWGRQNHPTTTKRGLCSTAHRAPTTRRGLRRGVATRRRPSFRLQVAYPRGSLHDQKGKITESPCKILCDLKRITSDNINMMQRVKRSIASDIQGRSCSPFHWQTASARRADSCTPREMRAIPPCDASRSRVDGALPNGTTYDLSGPSENKLIHL